MTNEQDIANGKQEWSKEYDFNISNPPKEGDILYAYGDDDVLLTVELIENNPPFVYGRAYVPEIVGHPLGWFLQGANSQIFHGWKSILLPRARTDLIKKFGLQNETMLVKSLKVVRLSQSGKSLLCEVHEYCVEETKEENLIAHTEDRHPEDGKEEEERPVVGVVGKEEEVKAEVAAALAANADAEVEAQ